MKQSHGFSVFVFNVHLLWFMVNDQIEAHFFSMYLFHFSTCFEQPRAHRQKNCASIWSFTWIITNALSTKYKIHFNTILIYAYVFQVGSFLRVFRSKPCTLLLALYIVVSLIFNLTTAVIFGEDLCTIFSNVLLNHQSEFEILSSGRRSQTK